MNVKIIKSSYAKLELRRDDIFLFDYNLDMKSVYNEKFNVGYS
jgi:hypothetical protein